MRNPIIIILTILFLMVSTLSCAQEKAEVTEATTDNHINWLEDYDMALEKASQENKVVLINFTGSDWCKWCIRLVDEVFSHQEFADYADKHLVMLKIDFPTTFQQLPQEEQLKRQELQQKYGVRGYPTILLTDAEGKVIGQTGYQSGGPQKYIDHLEMMINK